MKNRGKFILVALVFLVVFMVGCSNEEKLPVKSKNKNLSAMTKVLPDVKDKTSEAVVSDKKKIDDFKQIPEIKLDTSDIVLEWAGTKGRLLSATAKSFSGNQKENLLKLKNFSGIIYENKQKVATFNANQAFVDVKEKTVKAVGGVKVTSYTNKSVLTANRAIWISKENKIYADTGILATEYGKISGKTFVVDTALEIFEVDDRSIEKLLK